MSYNPQTEALLPAVIEIARAAGRAIMAIYEAGFTVQDKDDKSPLTEADMAAHHTIADGLARLTPDVPVLSEESASIPFAERARWQRYWLIDPLDGTREFIKRNGEFTVNIALIHEHRAVLGVVYAPALGLCYSATAGGVAHKQNGDEPPAEIRARGAPARITIAGSRSHRGDTLDAFLARIGEHEFISMGSALKSCLVAEGRADLYPRLGLTSEWDTAAAQCVVEAAGGRVTELSGAPLAYNTKDSLLNPHFLVFGDPSRDWPAEFAHAG
jgi:3'(2'), 5'-bisphosphate nucleotidase